MKVGFFVGCNTAFNRPDLEQAVRYAFPALGIELDNLEGQSCCPSWGTMPSVDVVGWCAVGARNHTIAEEKGLDIVTVCGSCYGSLAESKYKMDTHPEIKAQVNEILKDIGREYKGTSNVRLTFYYLYHELGPDKIKEAVKHKLDGLTVALQPGCHTLWPSKVYYDKEEDTFHPRVLKEMCEALGATVGHYTRLIDCCGMGAMRSTDMEKSFKLVEKKLISMKNEVNPDLIITGCSSCLIQLDTAQDLLRSSKKINFEIPVLHFMQVLALCLGADPERVTGLAKTDVSRVVNRILEG
ncbi:CoB--CoM heterodisulfide reductase iron-sulfur subunit B family protein [Desulfofundulus thermosubterraneus]|uniref:Heterodisulfide reductase subunit B n=1 Tax=Desulfofundulus thermosubterraneus DSM 16057 TaxID=1121432 RepID=A0A1M6DMQ0_9FIRM|nr:CoB--CoM heterodisulfide reductase iron-sulfur subunit B family protein [Desulfofundulus thermosubterraneus]SHI74421.1 heterodisulfide reductase subunit B [Desulfofundulus thermosubterraneus DSM 16057]